MEAILTPPKKKTKNTIASCMCALKIMNPGGRDSILRKRRIFRTRAKRVLLALGIYAKPILGNRFTHLYSYDMYMTLFLEIHNFNVKVTYVCIVHSTIHS